MDPHQIFNKSPKLPPCNVANHLARHRRAASVLRGSTPALSSPRELQTGAAAPPPQRTTFQSLDKPDLLVLSVRRRLHAHRVATNAIDVELFGIVY